MTSETITVIATRLRERLHDPRSASEDDALRGLYSAIGGSLTRGTRRKQVQCPRCGVTVNGARELKYTHTKTCPGSVA